MRDKTPTTTATTTTPTAAPDSDAHAAALARIAELEAKLRGKRKEKPAQSCACDCGADTKGGRFVPGHDAKKKAALIAAWRSDDSDAQAAAMTEATTLGWSRFLTAAPKTAKQRRDEQKAELASLRATLEAAGLLAAKAPTVAVAA